LDDIAEVYDCPHSTPLLVDETSAPYVVRSQDVRSGTFLLENAGRVSPTTYQDRIKRVQPQHGDLVYSREGTYFGIAAEVPKGIQVCLGQRMVLIRPDRKRLNAVFLKYWLNSPQLFGYIHGFRDGTVAERLNLPVIRGLPVAFPSLQEQDAVADALAALDDRIALLRETNATLEAIAQALFKSWFVDFDPVRAKQQGLAPEGMDEATAELFPDGFEDSAQGEIPKGWRFRSIHEVVEGVFDGPHATPPEATTGPVFLGIKNLTGSGLDLTDLRHIASGDFAQWTRRVTPQAGDIVFSYEATLGFFALIPPELQCCLGRRLALIRPVAGNGHGHFWFHQFVAGPFQRLLDKHTIHGATVNRIALKEFPSYKVLNPSDSVKTAFEAVAAPLWQRIHANQAAQQTLTSIRDTLLPRLISGQLRLPEAEAILEEFV
jgi:type I restriction enzyme S subunit